MNKKRTTKAELNSTKTKKEYNKIMSGFIDNPLFHNNYETTQNTYFEELSLFDNTIAYKTVTHLT